MTDLASEFRKRFPPIGDPPFEMIHGLDKERQRGCWKLQLETMKTIQQIDAEYQAKINTIGVQYLEKLEKLIM